MKQGISSICVFIILLGTGTMGPLITPLTVQSTLLPTTHTKNLTIPANTTFVFGCAGDADKLDPGDITDRESSLRTDQIFEGLVTYQTDNTLIRPCLAIYWIVSRAGTVLTFFLRHNVTFHDGTAFNATAVVFSLDRQFNQSNPYHQYGQWAYWDYLFTNIKKVTALNEYTVRITLDHPDSSILSSLAMPTAAIVSPTNAQLWGADANKHPCGTGPFQFVEWVPDDHITLTKNPQYWDGPPLGIDTLIFKVIPDPTMRLQALQNNTIQGMEYPAPAHFDTIQANQNLSLQVGASMSIGYLAINNGYGYNDTNANRRHDKSEPWVQTPGYSTPLTNRKVRQAMNYAINKTAIIALCQGTADTVVNGMPPFMLGYNDNIKDYPYDPDRARQLLTQAGYPQGFNTTLWVMPVSRPYMFDPTKIGEAIQSYLEAVNITIDIYQIDWSTYLEKTQAGEHPMCLLGWTGDNGDPDNFMNILYGANHCNLGNATNVAFYRNPVVQLLFTVAIHTYHDWQRAILYRIAQRIIHWEAPFVYLTSGVQHLAFQATVKGFIINPAERFSFHQVRFEN
ncbi:MAG: ABC transporter substrate-binding protein [Candidatus Thermoplasmatota archaeon]|nr:ABC transporter substrate-binding protein [Candidatus Thermoplasmatota archaeon]